MRYKVPEISKAVDGVMSQQLSGLAKMLGQVDVAVAGEEGGPEEEPEAADVLLASEEAMEDGEGGAEKSKVDEAFGDLSDG